MKRSAALALLLLMACGSGDDQGSSVGSAGGSAGAPDAEAPPKRPVSEYFVWGDASAAQGNFEADYADCTAQIEKDPALSNKPKLVEVAAYIQCMAPKGWKFVDPDAPQPQP